jgi:hypothetical protein
MHDGGGGRQRGGSGRSSGRGGSGASSVDTKLYETLGVRACYCVCRPVFNYMNMKMTIRRHSPY